MSELLTCPFHAAGGPERKTAPNGVGRPVEGSLSAGSSVVQDANGVWHVHGYAAARSLLRADGTRQAGFMSEQTMNQLGRMRPPVLFQDGEPHHRQRTKTARFFTPVTTDREYRGFMEQYADELIAELKARGEADISEVSMRLAVQVAARVIGLTNSRRPGMAARLDAFFDQGPIDTRWQRFWSGLRNQWRTGQFYRHDVQPAIAARKREPREDLISHLVQEGYNGIEILVECITFGAAGMVTTREFISVASWHFLEHPEERERYLAADEATRHHMLHELLRLEPVVGVLLRRAAEDVTFETETGPVTIPAGSLINVHIYDTNDDPTAVGPQPTRYCPERELPRGVQPYVMSFGDGHHRCPGAYIAIQETDIFLTRLLRLDGLRMVREPDMSRSELVKGYEIRGLRVQVDGVGTA